MSGSDLSTFAPPGFGLFQETLTRWEARAKFGSVWASTGSSGEIVDSSMSGGGSAGSSPVTGASMIDRLSIPVAGTLSFDVWVFSDVAWMTPFYDNRILFSLTFPGGNYAQELDQSSGLSISSFGFSRSKLAPGDLPFLFWERFSLPVTSGNKGLTFQVAALSSLSLSTSGPETGRRLGESRSRIWGMLGNFQLVDTSGNPVAGNLLGESGFDYSAPLPNVPEPGSVWLLIGGLSAAWIRAGLRRRGSARNGFGGPDSR
ncbi:MAG TPA: hypothetical protein DEH78_11255 [Solibacterales bacterium]|nr:hypothetical protein [Bryobacterales bacterium]